MSISPIAHFVQQGAVPTKYSLALYRKVIAVFYIEERMKAFTRQEKCSFWAPYRGHEVTQLESSLS